jgi:hypothetical protein
VAGAAVPSAKLTNTIEHKSARCDIQALPSNRKTAIGPDLCIAIAPIRHITNATSDCRLYCRSHGKAVNSERMDRTPAIAGMRETVVRIDD